MQQSLLFYHCSQNSTSQSTTSDTVSQEIEEPPMKRFKHLSRVDELLSEKEQSLRCARPSTASPEECELEKYCETNHKKDDLEVDPFNYWISNATVLSLCYSKLLVNS